tara:strand:- start:37 stop:423 length:387 start_codon:yes stop_codon:yes gene_type:complete
MKLLMENWRKYLTENDENLSQEAKLAMLALHNDESMADQALIMFEVVIDEIDLDLLAKELDERLSTRFDEIYYGADDWMNWAQILAQAESFISGKANKDFRLDHDELGNLYGAIRNELEQTADRWRNK